MDVFSSRWTPYYSLASTAAPSRCAGPPSTTRRRDAIVTLLAEAERPVMYVGGVLLARASGELRQFVEHLGLPVAYSLMGKGALSDDHPQTLGMTGFWGTQLVNDTCLAADVICAIGLRASRKPTAARGTGTARSTSPTRR